MRERRPEALRLRLQGEPTLTLPDGRVRALEPRAAALLALVAIEGVVARDRAATLLWSDSADPRAALRQQLARFRRLAGVALLDGVDRMRLAPGVVADIPPDAQTATHGAPLLGDLRFPDHPAFDRWLMRQRELSVALRPAAPGAAQPLLPPTLLRPPQLIGRTHEAAALAQAWDAGRAVLLFGEAGLGKSRLLAEFAQSRRVLLDSARPGDAGVPYATLTRLLRLLLRRCTVTLADAQRRDLARLLPEIAPGATLTAEGQRLALQVAVEHLLAGARIDAAPLAGVIVDDLHFADDASVEMLQALAAALAASLRFAFAQRPGEGGAATRTLRDTLQDGGLLTVLSLSPLSATELAMLLASLQIDDLDVGRLAAALARHTGGNPLFVLETVKQGLVSGRLRAGRLPQPGSVNTLIERRLKQLSPKALALARVAAIAGPDFDIALAEHATGERAIALADAWAELQDAQVLRDAAFAHDLVAEAVLRGVPAPIAREQHAAVATWLQQHAGEPARIAQHLLDAGALPESLQWLRAAGERARRAGRMLEAGRFWQRASEVCDRLGRADEAFDLLYEATCVMSESMGVEANAAHTDELLRRARGPGQRARALMMQADVEYERGAPRAQTIAEGLACARAAGDRHTEAQLLFEDGKRLATGGELRAARVQVKAALDLMEAAGGHDYVADKLSSLATLDSMLGDLRAADVAYERSRTLSLEHRIYEGQSMRLTSHALLKLELGDADGARARLDELAALEAEGRVTYGAGTYRRAMLKATLLLRLLLGEPAAALQLYLERIEGSPDAQDPGVAVLTAWLFDQIGRRDLSLQAVETARRGGPRNMSLVLIDALTLRDDPAAAAARWSGQVQLEGLGDVMSRCLLNGYLAVHAPGDTGLRALQSLCGEARANGWRGYLGGMLAALAELHARRGDHAEAAAAAADAEPLLAAPGMFSRAWGLLRCTSAYRLSGHADGAQRCAQAGAQLARATALTLPPPYQQAFLERHPVHRALLEAAQRRLG